MQIATRTAAVTHTWTDTAIRRRLSSGSTAAGSWHQTTSGRRGTGNESKPKRPRRRGAPQSLRHAVSVRRLISPRTPHRCIRMRGSFGVSGFRRRLMSSALLSCSGSRQIRVGWNLFRRSIRDAARAELHIRREWIDKRPQWHAANTMAPTNSIRMQGSFVKRRSVLASTKERTRKLHGAGVRGRRGLALQGRKVETRCPATKS